MMRSLIVQSRCSVTSSRRSVIGAWEKGTKQHTARDLLRRGLLQLLQLAGKKKLHLVGKKEHHPHPLPQLRIL